MTTWNELSDFVRANFKIANEENDMMMILFDTGDGRSQSVILARQTLLDEEEWLQIMSPIADLSSVNLDLQGALAAAGDIVCGGLALVGPLLVIRHAVPLANLDVNEFARPLILVTATADELEKTLVGSDSF